MAGMVVDVGDWSVDTKVNHLAERKRHWLGLIHHCSAPIVSLFELASFPPTALLLDWSTFCAFKVFFIYLVHHHDQDLSCYEQWLPPPSAVDRRGGRDGSLVFPPPRRRGVHVQRLFSVPTAPRLGQSPDRLQSEDPTGNRWGQPPSRFPYGKPPTPRALPRRPRIELAPGHGRQGQSRRPPRGQRATPTNKLRGQSRQGCQGPVLHWDERDGTGQVGPRGMGDGMAEEFSRRVVDLRL